MKKNIFAFFVGIILVSFTPETPEKTDWDLPYKSGEYLKYRIHYLGITAGYATLNVSQTTYNSTSHFHAVGKGWTIGATKVFFNVNDLYETYINTSTNLPSKFIRKIDEGGYTKDKVLTFDQNARKVTVKNNKNNTNKTYSISAPVQDMLSSFYYLRTYSNTNLKNNTAVYLKIFMDEEEFPFQMKIIGRETLKTKNGKVKCIKIRPFVQSGRVFKEKESVTMWVTDDSNLTPILIKAELAVGSLKAELYDYKNLSSTIQYF